MAPSDLYQYIRDFGCQYLFIVFALYIFSVQVKYLRCIPKMLYAKWPMLV